jgi:hypothetical protein
LSRIKIYIFILFKNLVRVTREKHCGSYLFFLCQEVAAENPVERSYDGLAVA